MVSGENAIYGQSHCQRPYIAFFLSDGAPPLNIGPVPQKFVAGAAAGPADHPRVTLRIGEQLFAQRNPQRPSMGRCSENGSRKRTRSVTTDAGPWAMSGPRVRPTAARGTNGRMRGHKGDQRHPKAR